MSEGEAVVRRGDATGRREGSEALRRCAAADLLGGIVRQQTPEAFPQIEIVGWVLEGYQR